MTRILVVEANSERAQAVAQCLGAVGYEVIQSQSVADGLRLLEAATVELIIVAAELPDGSGLDFCQRLPLVTKSQKIPVLLHAVKLSPPNMLNGLAAGATGYLPDELPPELVVDRVRHVLATGLMGNGHTTEANGVEQDIALRFQGEDYNVRASREQLLSVLLTTLEDLARANQQHEEELKRRREVEHKLRESEALYESLVETLPMNLFRKNRSGAITYANQRYLKSLGLNREEALGMTDFDLFPEELATKYLGDDEWVMSTRDVFECTESHVTRDGEKRYAHVLKTPVFDAHGTVIGTQGIFWDVTARRRAEEALEREQFLLSSLMDNVPDNIFFKDFEGRYLRVNRAMADRLGLKDPNDAVGRLADEFFPASYAQRVRERDAFVVQTGKAVIGEEEFVQWSDGSDRWLLITRMPLKDEHGQICGSFGLSHNITDQKKAQQAMQEARDAAQAASSAKSNFLANMSHEIRTPMNAIIGMTELVLDTSLTDSQRDYLTLVQESGEALLCVINDILDFSKIEAGKLELDLRHFQLREHLGDTLKSLAVRAHRNKLELAVHIAPQVPEYLIGDAGRLRQVIINLVGNAIKFTEAGEILVSVAMDDTPLQTTSASDAPASIMLHFVVKDTGIGIPHEKLDRIFDAFEQVDTSLTRRFEGTGLGLAISTRLVELMSGRIWVESALGSGSSFHFTAKFGVSEERLPTSRFDSKNLSGRRILVVDDNATNRRILDEILRSWLITPEIVDGVAAAISAMEAARDRGRNFDLVLTDVNMPGEDGFNLVEKLRARPDLNTPVIMMLTSSGRIGDVARCNELGIGSYLIKPVKQSELFDSLVELLDVQRVEDDHGPGQSEVSKHSRVLDVLLAEDSRVNQKLAIALLEKWGHRVTVASNGREAVEDWARGKFDVILMDVQMPEMDGLEATRRIRDREVDIGTHIPIVAMTAHALKGDEERCLASGMDSYLTKPIRAPKLFEYLAEICDAAARVETPPTTEKHAATDSAVDATPVDEVSNSAPQQAVQSPTTHYVDWSRVDEVVGNDNDLKREILEAILQECPAQFQSLDAALAAGDAPTVRRAAHTILGNMRALGAEYPMQAASNVEMLAKAGKLSDIPSPLDHLRSVVADVSLEIQAWLNGG